MVGLHDTYIQFHPFSTWLGLTLPLWCIYRGTKERKHQGVEFTFGRALSTGLIITLIGAIMVIPAQFFYHQALNPDYFMTMIDYDAHMLQSDKLSLEQARALVSRQYNLTSYLVYSSLSMLFFGGIFSLVNAFLQREKSK